jgi:hypothetical protein
MRKYKQYSYTEEEFLEAIKTSTSKAQVIAKLGLSPKGGNYRVFNRLAKELNADMSHFLGQAHNKGKYFGPKRDIEDYLSNKIVIGSHKLRKRLIREGFFNHKCYKCNNTEWLGQPISLELEHIDGNHDNNNLSNLTLLCPNCHAQTSTYRGKNKK